MPSCEHLGETSQEGAIFFKFNELFRVMNEDLLLIKQLEGLRLEHRDLDDKIKTNGIDEFTRKRLQKTKLALRDKINELERILYPDVIA